MTPKHKIQAATKVRITKMSCDFMLDDKQQVWLIWVPLVEVSEWQQWCLGSVRSWLS